MKFRTIQTTIFTVCLCACMTAFIGCSKQTNEPYEMPSGDSLTESSDDSSSESSELSGDDTSTESESSEPQASSGEEYPEIVLDHEYLETVKEDMLYVNIHLHMDVEALRAEFEENYPEFIGKDNLYYYYWPRYLNAHNEPIMMRFLQDYDINYENVVFLKISTDIRGYFDKSVISSMLDDLRVGSLIYYPGGDPLSNLHY